jgi:Tol biopolymer transport system component
MTILPDDRVGTAIIDVEGNVLRTLDIADPTLNLVCTVWSADDSRLVCEGWDDTDESRRGLYAVSSVDGGDLLRVTEPPSGSADLPGDLSADGRLVFKRYSGDEAPGALWIVPLTGGDATLLSDGSFEDPGRFSPDGALIASSIDGQVVFVDRAGGDIQALDVGGRYEFGPDWSPDGEWIVFSSTESAFRADLFISRPDGAERYAITDTPDNEITVDWGPQPSGG